MNVLTDQQILTTVQQSHHRHLQTLSMTANENVTSNTARQFSSDGRYNKYLFACTPAPGFEYAADYHGMAVETFPEIHLLEQQARFAAKILFSCDYVEFRVLSGVHAMMTTISILSDPGETIISLSENTGGHFATKMLCVRLGRQHVEVDLNSAGQFSAATLTPVINTHKDSLRMVFIDHSCPLNDCDVAILKKILAQRVNHKVLIIYDVSHALGLIAGGVFANPLSFGADIIQGNTHKTFPGPHRAMVLFADAKIYQQYQQMLGTCLISSPHLPSLVELYITLLEMKQMAVAYAQHIKRASTLLAESIMTEWHPHHVQAGHSHIVLLYHPQANQVAHCLNELGLRVNSKSLYGRTAIRFGTQEIVRRGIMDNDICQLGALIAKASVTLKTTEQDRQQLQHIASHCQQIQYSFDSEEHDEKRYLHHNWKCA